MPEQVQPGAPGHPSAAELDGLRWRAANGGTGGPLLADWGDMVLMRADNNPQRPVLMFTREEIVAFFDGVKAGEFDDFCQLGTPRRQDA